MLSLNIALTIALPVALLLGYMAQDTGLCLVRGVNEAKVGQPSMLASILLSGVMLWLFVPLAAGLHTSIPFARYAIDPWFIVGGLLFGIAAAINGGCAVSTLSRFARGELRMALTMIGWPIGWWLWMAAIPNVKHTALAGPGTVAATSTIAIALAVSAWALSGPMLRRRHWWKVMTFGAMAGLLFIIEPHWSPSDYVRDVGNSLTARMHLAALPDLLRTALIACIIIGMAGCALRRGSFATQTFRLTNAAVHLGAGIAMGIGAALAMGGNDKQLLTGVPALSPGAIGTVFAMLTGILLGGPVVRWLRTKRLT